MPSFDPPVLRKPSAPKPAPVPLLPPGTLTFAGLDRDQYPGDDVMRSLVTTTNINWTGFYLTPAPSLGRDKGWMGKHDFLRRLGYGLAPVYVGRQIETIPNADHRITPDNGVKDGLDAARLAGLANIAKNSVIYLDIESGGPATPIVISYFVAWASALRSQNFLPGLYANSSLATGLSAFVPDSVVWSVNLSKVAKKNPFKTPYPQPHPAGSGTAKATHWQLVQGISIEFDSITGGKKRLQPVDLNSSLVSDPSVRARF